MQKRKHEIVKIRGSLSLDDFEKEAKSENNRYIKISISREDPFHLNDEIDRIMEQYEISENHIIRHFKKNVTTILDRIIDCEFGYYFTPTMEVFIKIQ